MKMQACTCKFPHTGSKYRLWTWEEYGGHYTPGPTLEKTFENARYHARHDGIAFNRVKAWEIQELETRDVVVKVKGPLTLAMARKAGLDV